MRLERTLPATPRLVQSTQGHSRVVFISTSKAFAPQIPCKERLHLLLVGAQDAFVSGTGRATSLLFFELARHLQRPDLAQIHSTMDLLEPAATRRLFNFTLNQGRTKP